MATLTQVLTSGNSAGNLSITEISALSTDADGVHPYATQDWVTSQHYLPTAPPLADILRAGGDAAGQLITNLGELAFGEGATADFSDVANLGFYPAGDAPGNPMSPVGWIKVQMAGPGAAWIPWYQ